MPCNNRRLGFGVIPAVLAIGVLCAVAASPAFASILTLNPIADANSNGHDAGAYGLEINSGNVAIVDYNLSALPAGATINGATLFFNVYGYSPSGIGAQVIAFPKSSSTITGSDISAGGDNVYGPDAIQLGAQTVNLEVPSLSPMLTDDYLGIRFQYSYGESAQISSVENAPYVPTSPPTMTIDYQVPEPASLGLMTVGGLALLARRRR